MDKVELFPTRKRMLFVFFCGVLMTVISVFLLNTGWTGYSNPSGEMSKFDVYFMGVSGILSFCLFVPCTLVAFKKLLNPDPMWILDQSGLISHSFFFGTITIPWSEIEGLGFYVYQYQHFLGINLRDQGLHTPGITQRKIKMFKLNRGLVGFDFAIPRLIIDRDLETIAEMIIERCPQLQE